MAILEVNDLIIDFKTHEAEVRAVNKVSFQIEKGKTMGLVGESGSGKSVTSLAIMGLVPNPPGEISGGEILFEGQDIVQFSEAQLRQLRGNDVSMIFQEPMTSLNPVFTVGFQVSEVLILHQGMNKKEAWEKSIDLLDQVGIPNPRQKINSYPHEMSGGQKQRVMIAMAIGCNPKLLIADEPTTALDVTIQKQVLELLAELQQKNGMSMLFITHDLGVIADIADDVLVMYRGDLVEQGKARDLFMKPQHPYTKGLLACRPRLDNHPHRLATVSDFMDESGVEITSSVEFVPKKARPESDSSEKALVRIENLKKHFPIKGGFFGGVKNWVKAVDDVSLTVRKGRTLGLVGESGCGKTTLGRSVLRLIEPSGGKVFYDGVEITSLSKSEMRKMRKRMQIIFQDPYASLNPRMTIGATLMEPMIIHKLCENTAERRARAEKLIERVGLSKEVLSRYPHEFSGGQRQRICIARALAVRPEFIICDESVSALDVSIQAQILNLLLDLQDELGLTYIFISHDLAVVKFVSDEVAVMFEGKVMEYASGTDIYERPQHEYTKKLLSAIPKGITA